MATARYRPCARIPLATLTALAALLPASLLQAQADDTAVDTAADTTVRLAPLAVASLPGDQILAGGAVGGISGLAWDERLSRFLAVTDDRARPRVFAIDFQLLPADADAPDAQAPPARAAATIVAAYPLPMREDAAHNPRDAEAIAPAGSGAFAVAFESPPAFIRYDAAFTRREALALVPEDVASRLMPNRSMESLALIPAGGPLGDAPALLAITEWGPEPADRSIQGTRRLEARGQCLAFVLDPRSLEVRSRGVYPLGLPFTTRGAKTLVDIEPIAPDAFLALERFAAPGGLFAFDLYLARIQARGDGFTIVKTPIDVPAIPGRERVGNVEALAIGPALHDDMGGSLLLLATDNNFGETAFGREHTDLLAFRLIGQAHPE